MVLIDLSKAICHSLLRKLEATGVSETALTWFSSYLMGWRQRVLTHSACSYQSWSSTAQSVSMLTTPPSMLATQTLLQLATCLKKDLRHICKWLEHNELKINVEKTQLMVLCSHWKSHQEDQVEVNIGTSVLQKQKSVKYLGVTVDKHLASLYWHCAEKLFRQNCSHQKSQFLPNPLPVLCPTPPWVLLSGLEQLWGNPYQQTGRHAELRSTRDPE